jgi:hypothetical protein
LKSARRSDPFKTFDVLTAFALSWSGPTLLRGITTAA